MVSTALLTTAKILVVDDDENILTLCESVLREAGYVHVRTTPDSCGVLAQFVEYDPDLILLDIHMPGLDGVQLLHLLQRTAPEGLALPVVVMTALATPELRLRALQTGAVDVLAKPFDCDELVARVGNLLRLRMKIRDADAQTQALFEELLARTEDLSDYQLQLKEAQLEVIARLARAGEQHDADTGQHTQRVAVTSRLLAQELGVPAADVETIQRAAPLHDVGKIGVPDAVLLKAGSLNAAETALMRQHCQFGSSLLAGGRSEIVRRAEIIALTHHEKWNGQGYPRGLEKESIPLEGRILTVADVFDALTHKRPYKHAWAVPAALDEIRREAGAQFDPRVVDAFLRLPHEDLV